MSKSSLQVHQSNDARENASFQNLLILGSFVLLLIWSIEHFLGLTELFDTLGYSITLAVVAMCYWLSRYRNRSKLAKTIVFFQIALYLLAMTIVGFFHALDDQSIYPLASTLQWLPIIYVTAFLFLSKRLAMVSSLVIFGLLVILLGITYSPLIKTDNIELNALMFNMVLAHCMYIVSLFSVMRLRLRSSLQQIRQQELEKQANLDSLLGIANRRYLQKLMDRFAAEKHPISILLIDVDHFKSVNDTYGHSAGDDVLKTMVRCFRESLRPVDIIGRWGGEEFLVLADCTEDENAMSLAQRIRQQVQQQSFQPLENITVSIGIAEYSGQGEIENTFNQADKALYRAKESGRNQVVDFASMENQ